MGKHALIWGCGWLGLLGFWACGAEPGADSDSAWPTQPAAVAALYGAQGPCWVDDTVVRDFGKVVYTGDMDLTHEVRRILHGDHLPYPHDGTVFANREHRLPERPRSYYREYVHPTPGIRGPGPQRLVRGAGGDVNYTPDHYATFTMLDPGCAASIATRLGPF